MVDPKRIERLRTQIAAYEANLTGFQRITAELKALRPSEHRDRLLAANHATILAIQRSIAIARQTLATLEKAPRVGTRRRG